MAHLYNPVLADLVSPWLKQRRRKFGEDKWHEMMEQLKTTTLVYVGNLSFFTREEQIDRFFSTIAPVKRIIMGLNRQSKTPCGFCFVDYYTHKDAVAAVHFLNGSKLDGRVVRIDLDPGFEEGRQYGRGMDGGQRRDDYREDFDYGRGGYGTLIQKQADTPPAITTAEDGGSNDNKQEGGGVDGDAHDANQNKQDLPMQDIQDAEMPQTQPEEDGDVVDDDDHHPDGDVDMNDGSQNDDDDELDDRQ